MNDSEIIARGNRLRIMRDGPGYSDLLDYLQETSDAGWEDFIALPVEKKTGKLAQKYQAQYLVLRDIVTWLDRCIKDAERAGK